MASKQTIARTWLKVARSNQMRPMVSRRSDIVSSNDIEATSISEQTLYVSQVV